MSSLLYYNLLFVKLQIFRLTQIKLSYILLQFISCFNYPISIYICHIMSKKEEIMISEDNFAERLSQLREAKQVSAREMSLSIGQNCTLIRGV